jgi:hypothetical protein
MSKTVVLPLRLAHQRHELWAKALGVKVRALLDEQGAGGGRHKPRR